MTSPNRPPRRIAAPRRHVWRTWALAVAAGLLAAWYTFSGAETAFRSLKTSVHTHDASGRVVVVEIDDRSLAAIKTWPVPRSVYATLTQKLFEAGARRVFLDVDFTSPQDAAEDGALARTLRDHHGQVVLASRVISDARTGQMKRLDPIPSLRAVADVASASFPFDELGNVWHLPYALAFGGSLQDGMAARMAGRSGASSALYAIDGSIRLESIPRTSLTSVLGGKAGISLFGRDVIVGATSEQAGDMARVPPYGRIGSVYLQAIGAETLREGRPVDLGFLPFFSVAALAALFGILLANRWYSLPVLVGAFCAVAAGALALPVTVTSWIVPGLTVLLVATVLQTTALVRDVMRARATINQVSGLLNLTALRQLPPRAGSRLVVAHIHNFAEATATLPDSGEAALIAQIASRLRLGMTGADLYHGDNGVFAWFSAEDMVEVGERLDALHALFRSAVTVDAQTLDLQVTFGVDDDDARAVANRLGSALVAATEAATEGARWREFDKAKLADTAWKLSMLSELDAAIDDGALWVAYQPKLDLRARRIVGAEALVRWTHPEKGAISPIEFVAAAEQHNRIEKLTAHVLERAVLAAATINGHDIAFGIAVNLSARLLESGALVGQVAAVLARHGLDPQLLTLEVTETATLASDRSLDTLHRLRALGVHISIDDYGTGLSTLEYLRKIPASEIKIDRSFVQALLASSSDLLMVNSTIQLAHSLGHSVVAEGVETADALVRLAELGCDVAQGYHIGRPMAFQDLARRLLAERRRAA